MDLRQLQSFVSVVRCESFTRAAEVLGVSQPTISTHLRALEEELGTTLVLRGARRVELTPQGARVFEQASSMLALRDRLLEDARSRERNAIYLGSSSVPSAYVLPDALSAFTSAWPGARFRIFQHDSREVVSGLAEGSFDLGLTGLPADEPSLECVPLCADDMVLVTPAEDRFRALAGAGAEAVRELLLRERTVLRGEGSGSRSTMDRILEELGLAGEGLDVVARTNDQETIRQLVEAGLGVTVMSSRAARAGLEAGRLLQFELPCQASRRSLYVAWRRNSALDEPTRAFRDFLRQRLAGE